MHKLIQTETENFTKQDKVGLFNISITALILNHKNQVFLGKRASGRANAEHWELVNGRVDQGESIISALHREVKEELGIEITPIDVIGFKHCLRTSSEPEHQGIVFLCKTKQSDDVAIKKDETSEFGWFSLGEALTKCEEYEKPFVSLAKEIISE